MTMGVVGGVSYEVTGGTGYLVPKLTGTAPLFAAGIWVGGTVGGELRVAGATYDDFEFWPGPLDEGGALPNPADCSGYDRIWVVSAFDLADYEATGVATGDLAEWPVALGAEVVLVGHDFDAARLAAETRASGEGLRYIHSANEPLLIAGVATYTLEFWLMRGRRWGL